MTVIVPKMPVIVGIGSRQIRSDNPSDCPEAYQLMVKAIRDAAQDCRKKITVKAGDDFAPIELAS